MSGLISSEARQIAATIHGLETSDGVDLVDASAGLIQSALDKKDEQIARQVELIKAKIKEFRFPPIARQVELIKAKIKEFRFPPIDRQRAVNCGINIFALDLLTESIGKILPALSDQEWFFEITHRGVRLNCAAKLVQVPAPSEKSAVSAVNES